jgi:hypothetical protein
MYEAAAAIALDASESGEGGLRNNRVKAPAQSRFDIVKNVFVFHL